MRGSFSLSTSYLPNVTIIISGIPTVTKLSHRRSYTSIDSGVGVQDTAVSPMNDKEMQTVESTKVTAVQCSMLNVSHLQEICNEIDAQIVSVRNRVFLGMSPGP